jgi:hypothetical protein
VLDIQCLALDDFGLEEFVDFIRTPHHSFGVEIEQTDLFRIPKSRQVVCGGDSLSSCT